MQTDDWVLEDTPEPGSKEAQLAAASKALAMGQYQEAMRLSSIWMQRNKYDPLLGEAHLIHGDALFAQEYYYESLFDYEFVAKEYYGTREEIYANEKELRNCNHVCKRYEEVELGHANFRCNRRG